MKYNGIELVEITEPGNIVFPKKMVVWDNMGLLSKEPCVRMVLALVKDNVGTTKVIASQLNMGDAGVTIWNHCAEIPEEPKPRRATLRELAKWCAQGNGEIQDANKLNCVFTGLDYCPDCDDRAAPDIYKIRKWDDKDFHEPTVDYMGLEAK